MRHMGYALVAICALGAGGGVVLADYMYSGEAEKSDAGVNLIGSTDADTEMARAYDILEQGGQGVSAAPTANPLTEMNDSYRIVGVGDVMLGSDWPEPYMDERMIEGGDPAAVIGAEMLGIFQSADVTFGNFEGTMHTSSAGAKACGNPTLCYTFRSPPWHAGYLRSAGFTLMSNANNHARDFGENGRAETYRHLTGAGIAVSGGDSPSTRFGYQTLADGTRVGLVAFGHNPGLMQVNDLTRMARLVQEAHQSADMVIVSCHIGAEGAKYERLTRAPEEFVGENRGNPFAFGRAAVDAGADIVFCHGPHVTRAVEVYKGRFIAYSLGNFWTFGRFNLNGLNSFAPIADLQVARDGALLSGRIVSAKQVRPGGPFLDPTNAAAQFMGTQSRRDIPESGTDIAADGTIIWPQ